MGSKQGQYKMRTTHVDRHVETVVGIHAKSSDSSFFRYFIFSYNGKEVLIMKDLFMLVRLHSWSFICSLFGVFATLLTIGVIGNKLKKERSTR